MYKIFINDKPFIIVGEDEAIDSRFKICKRVTYDPLKTASYIRDCEGKKHEGFVLISDDVEFAFLDVCTHFAIVEAAGGVVFNANNEVLLIKRLGKWDLPKGKMEGEETNEQSAIREVEEECGITGLTIEKALTDTFHVYKLKNFFHLKITHWYTMRVDGVPELTPQKEESITQAIWKPWAEVNPDTLDTYISIAELLKDVKRN
jgi:8-oxo-dGTP pyrophosphatase MutT (NUDIX family)